jgi:hypothetical protein
LFLFSLRFTLPLESVGFYQVWEKLLPLLFESFFSLTLLSLPRGLGILDINISMNIRYYITVLSSVKSYSEVPSSNSLVSSSFHCFLLLICLVNFCSALMFKNVYLVLFYFFNFIFPFVSSMFKFLVKTDFYSTCFKILHL